MSGVCSSCGNTDCTCDDAELGDLLELANAWQSAVQRLRARSDEVGRHDIDFDNLPPVYFNTFVVGYKAGWRAAEQSIAKQLGSGGTQVSFPPKQDDGFWACVKELCFVAPRDPEVWATIAFLAVILAICAGLSELWSVLT